MNQMKKTNKQHLDKIKDILRKPYARQLIPDVTGGFTALIQEFPGCFAEGDTPQEALDNLNEAAFSWLESSLSNGYPVREPIDYSGYSGKIALRIPRGLHKQIAELAELEDTSINQLIVSAISEYVGCKNTEHIFLKSIQDQFFSIKNDLRNTILVAYPPRAISNKQIIAFKGKTISMAENTPSEHFITQQ